MIEACARHERQCCQVEALAENVDAKRAAAESRVELCEGKLEAARQSVLDTWTEAKRCMLATKRCLIKPSHLVLRHETHVSATPTLAGRLDYDATFTSSTDSGS